MTEKENGELRIGVYVCHCGLNIAGSVDCEAVTEFARELDDVAHKHIHQIHNKKYIH